MMMMDDQKYCCEFVGEILDGKCRFVQECEKILALLFTFVGHTVRMQSREGDFCYEQVCLAQDCFERRLELLWTKNPREKENAFSVLIQEDLSGRGATKLPNSRSIS